MSWTRRNKSNEKNPLQRKSGCSRSGKNLEHICCVVVVYSENKCCKVICMKVEKKSCRLIALPFDWKWMQNVVDMIWISLKASSWILLNSFTKKTSKFFWFLVVERGEISHKVDQIQIKISSVVEEEKVGREEDLKWFFCGYFDWKVFLSSPALHQRWFHMINEFSVFSVLSFIYSFFMVCCAKQDPRS